MRLHPVSWLGSACAVVFASACAVTPGKAPESSSERTKREFIERHNAARQRNQDAADARAAEDQARRKKEQGPALPPLGDCPADMAVSPGPRPFDTRKLREAKIDNFAKGHTLPPPDSFVLPKDKAIELVLAVEKRVPGLIPAGFRDAVKQSPNDAALRLRMARCELEHDETRRRASYDAALAILMAGPSEPAMGILIESTKRQLKREFTSTCSQTSDCGKGWTCDPVQRTCTNATEQLTSHISMSEFEIEDALTRALFKAGMTFEQYKQYDYFWWLATRLHRCGGSGNAMCELSGYRDKVVSWDLRDGGRSYSPPENVQQWYRDHCVRGSITDCDRKKPSWVP